MDTTLLTDFEAVFQRRGLKLTHQRLEIYKALLASRSHPTAETLYGQLRKTLPTISLDTVYRNLHTMEKYGLVSRVATGESQARFEANLHSHHHLICTRCNKITDINWLEFEQLETPTFIKEWGRMENRQVTITGICQACLEKK